MSPASPSRDRLFFVLAFVVAAGVGVAIAYLGVRGMIGGPIP